MQEERASSGPNASRAGTAALHAAAVSWIAGLLIAALWDVAGSSLALPARWPVFSYVLLAFVIVAGCISVLLRMLLVRRVHSRAHSNRVRNATDLLAIGLLLGTWHLRADPAIPPDMPLIASEIAALALAAAPLIRLVKTERASQ